MRIRVKKGARKGEQTMGKNELNNLTDLIRVYDAANQLYIFSRHLTGPTLSQESIISELMRVTDVIKRMSPLYEAGVDWDESRIRKVLDGEGSAEERAEQLLKV
jgi:hypothetical protein